MYMDGGVVGYVQGPVIAEGWEFFCIVNGIPLSVQTTARRKIYWATRRSIVYYTCTCTNPE